MKRFQHLVAATGVAALLAVPALADSDLGRVTSVSGDATAQLPGEPLRTLACGDPVYPGDTVRTAEASRVGILAGDVMTELAADSQLRLEDAGRGLPSATLERGKLRMLDPRDGGRPARVAVLDVRADVVGNDVEAYVFSEKIGPYAMLCEWDTELPVTRGADERQVAQPRECVISKPSEPLYTARAHDVRIPVAAADVCGVDPGLLASEAGSPTHHLSPADVAAPGPIAGIGTAGLGFHNPQGAQMPTRSACDNPGGGCTLPLPAAAIRRPAVTGPAPGAGGGGLGGP